MSAIKNNASATFFNFQLLIWATIVAGHYWNKNTREIIKRAIAGMQVLRSI